MKVTNTHVAALVLPDGTRIEAGDSADIAGWENIKNRGSVKKLIDSGVLKIGGKVDVKRAEESPKDEKEELFAKLDAAGIEYDKRWGAAKLREALSTGDEE